MILKVLISRNTKKVSSFARASISHRSISAAPPTSFSTLSVQQRVFSQEHNQYFPRGNKSTNASESADFDSVREVKGTSTPAAAAKVTDAKKLLNQLDNYSYAQLKKIGRAFGVSVDCPQDTLLESIKKLQQLSISQVPAQVLQKLVVNEVNKIADEYKVPHRATKHDTLRVIREHDHGKSVSVEVFLTMINRIQPMDGMQRVLGAVSLPAGMKSFPLMNGKLRGSLSSPLNKSFSFPSVRHKVVDPDELNIIKARHLPKLKAFQLFMQQCQKEHSAEAKQHLPNMKNFLRKYLLEPTPNHANQSPYPILTAQYFQQPDKELFTLSNNELLLSYFMDFYYQSIQSSSTAASAGRSISATANSSSSSRAFSSSSSAVVETISLQGMEMEDILPATFMKKIILNTLKYYQDLPPEATTGTTTTTAGGAASSSSLVGTPVINNPAAVVQLTRPRVSIPVPPSSSSSKSVTPVDETPAADATAAATTTVPTAAPIAPAEAQDMLPLTVVGDLLGSISAINHIFSEVMGQYPSAQNPYVFLGNVISFRPYDPQTAAASSSSSSSTTGPITISDLIGTENMAILLHFMHLKLSCPEAITMLQGGQEYQLIQYLQHILDTYAMQRHQSFASSSSSSSAKKAPSIYPVFDVLRISEEDIKLVRAMHRILSSLPVAAQLENECFLVSSGIGKQTMTLTNEDMNYIMSLKGKSAVKMSMLAELLFAEPHFPSSTPAGAEETESQQDTNTTTAAAPSTNKKQKKSKKNDATKTVVSSSSSSSGAAASSTGVDHHLMPTLLHGQERVYLPPQVHQALQQHNQFDATILRRFLRHQQMKYMICSNTIIDEGFYQYNPQCVVIDSAPHRMLPATSSTTSSSSSSNNNNMKKGVVLRFDDRQSMRYVVLPFTSLN